MNAAPVGRAINTSAAMEKYEQAILSALLALEAHSNRLIPLDSHETLG